MKTNFSQGRNWITSAINDVNIIINSLKRKFYSIVAFRCQFSIVKFNKSLLSLMGVKIEKMHNPSKILRELIHDEKVFNLSKNHKNLFELNIKFSEFFEEQGTITRYGVLEADQIKFPEDIYHSLEKVREFIKNLFNYLENFLEILKQTFNITESQFEDLKKLKKQQKKLKKWT